jgi:hypothetical protein
MSTLSIEKPRKKATARGKRTSEAKAATGREAKSTAALAKMPDESQAEARTTKHERVLTLLSRPEGASIEDIMQATEWQQHSVRGFLAGTVKKKLGFTLTSSKAPGDVRRYRIEAKRGR